MICRSSGDETLLSFGPNDLDWQLPVRSGRTTRTDGASALTSLDSLPVVCENLLDGAILHAMDKFSSQHDAYARTAGDGTVLCPC